MAAACEDGDGDGDGLTCHGLSLFQDDTSGQDICILADLFLQPRRA